MFELMFPTQTGLALAETLLVAMLTYLVPKVFDPRNMAHRAILTLAGIALSLRYLLWRLTETLVPFAVSLEALASWGFALVETLSIASAISSWVILSRYRSRSADVEANLTWWGENPPRVAVLIPTVNEERSILRRTVIGAEGIDYPNFEICILDDGQRDWLKAAAKRRGVSYFSRTSNEGAKAGNINAALAQLMARENPPEFIAVLDADFVPHQSFIRRTLSLMHDRTIGLVQTPQHYFNADPLQHNLGVSRAYPDEQRFFFDCVLEARDGWDTAFCCGTSCLIRVEALVEVGGFPTESVTEDMMLTFALRTRNWSTAYLNEALSEGLAPEGIAEYINQRARWCLGAMQIVRGRLGIFSRENLRLRDRWSLVDALLYWQITFFFRLAAIAFPLLYWFGGVVVVRAELPDVIKYFGPYYIWTAFQLNFIAGNKIVPIFNDVNLLVGARQIILAAWQGLFGAKTQSFKVTSKGGDRTKLTAHHDLIGFFVGLLVLNVLGMAGIVLFPDHYQGVDSDGKVIVIFWTLYNIAVLALTAMVCIDRPRIDTRLNFTPEPAQVFIDGQVVDVWISDMTTNTMRIRGLVPNATREIEIDLRGIGPIKASISEHRATSTSIALLPTEPQYEALLRKFHAGGRAPGTLHFDLTGIFRAALRRLVTTTKARS